jgi:hypothetical protein
MDISTEFLTDYLLEKGLDWKDFEFLSPIAVQKKDKIIADWRLGNTLNSEVVNKIFRAFKDLYRNDKPIEGLSYDDFMKAYLNKVNS